LPATTGNDFRQRIERQAVKIETQEKGEAGGPNGHVVPKHRKLTVALQFC
jgi:hypothetical protein